VHPLEKLQIPDALPFKRPINSSPVGNLFPDNWSATQLAMREEATRTQ